MLFLCFFVLIVCPLGAMSQFNMTEYRRMPPLHDLDDYDACLEVPEPSSYCLVIGQILPNDTSALWHQIANFSADTKRHFRHDFLYFGVCVNRCKKLMHPLSSFHKDQLYAGNIKNTELIEFFTDVDKRESDNRVLYHKLINTCLNYDFQKHYDLQVGSFIQYCVSNQDPTSYSFLEIVLFVVIGTLLLLIALSTSYDRQLKCKTSSDLTGNEFYKHKLYTQQDLLLTSFSLCRNYYRFVEPARSPAANDLRFLEAYRFFATLMVIFAHVLLLLKAIPVQNTNYAEAAFYKLGSNLIINGSVIIQVFLVMSSFLLCVSFQQTLASRKPGVAEWGGLILYRYLRLAPSLAFSILLNASILPRLQDGPIWRHIIEAEYVFCKEKWWANLLFINNFTLRKSCLHQTWYIAADFQLYVLLSAVLIFTSRFPRTRNYVLGAGAVMAFLTTGMVTYFLKLDGVHQETPDSYRYMFWTNGETIYQGYTPFYMNFGGFFFGTIAGLIYLKYKKEGLDLKGRKTKLNWILMVCFPLPFLLLLSGEIFYRYEIKKPSIWIGIYAGLYRNVWAILCCGLILLMCFKIGKIVYKFTSMKIFVPLGRLSFQCYMIHTVVIRCVVGYVRQPLYTNNMFITIFIVASFVLSFLAAFLLYMLFELPLTNILGIVMKGNRGKKSTDALHLDQKKVEEKKDTTQISQTA